MKRSTDRAITLVAHGSRLSSANLFLKNLTRRFSRTMNVNIGFLELSRPHFLNALVAHAKKGARFIHVLPLFLAPGKHMQKDIPKIIAEFSRRYPQVQVELADFLGSRKAFVRLLQEWITQRK